MNPFEFEFLRTLLLERAGLEIAPEQAEAVESRLDSVCRRFALASASALVARLRERESDTLIEAVLDALSTRRADFFRDRLAFQQFRDTILPDLLRRRATERRLRIWSAACSTGQEPYSLAIALREMPALRWGWRVEVLATDQSRAALEKAKRGVFSHFEVQRGLPIRLLIKHFTRTDAGWEISPELRAMVEFKPRNLLQPFTALGSFDVIFCGGGLNSLAEGVKRDVVSRLAQVLALDGFLVTGPAEVPTWTPASLRAVSGKPGLFSRWTAPIAVPERASTASDPGARAATVAV